MTYEKTEQRKKSQSNGRKEVGAMFGYYLGGMVVGVILLSCFVDFL